VIGSKYPWRESNSHPQLRKLSLCPLSYRGRRVALAPLAGIEPATPGPGNRCAIHLRYKGVGALGGVEPSTVESQTTVLSLHHERQDWLPHMSTVRRHTRSQVCRQPLCGGGGSRTPNRVSRGGSLATSCNTILPRLPTKQILTTTVRLSVYPTGPPHPQCGCASG